MRAAASHSLFFAVSSQKSESRQFLVPILLRTPLFSATMSRGKPPVQLVQGLVLLDGGKHVRRELSTQNHLFHRTRQPQTFRSRSLYEEARVCLHDVIFVSF